MKNASTALLRTIVAGTLTAMPAVSAAQQVYPNRAIRIIVPTVAGGSTTTIARLVAQHFTATFAQPAIVDNRPGGNTVVGTDYVARAAPDGYTLLVPSITHIVLPLLTATPYDAIRDFAPVSSLASQMYVMVLHPSVPARNIREFVALAKPRPGQVDYSISGAASGGRLAAELFSMVSGVKMQMIPYKGGAQALIDLVGGQVQVSFQAPITVMAHIKSGRLRGVAVTGEARSQVLPQIPTMAEAGLSGVVIYTWQGMLAPAGTPREILDKLAGEIQKVLSLPETTARLDSQGVTPFPSTPDAFTALLKSDTAKIANIVKVANIKIEN